MLPASILKEVPFMEWEYCGFPASISCIDGESSKRKYIK
jgi:hypothetical protein